jgi:serine/threonine protein kinase
MSTNALQPAMTDDQLEPPSTSSSAEADDERSTHPSFSSSSADLDATRNAVYDLTDNKYILISPAGAGICARLLFCTAIPTPRQPPELVVVKIPADRWHRLKLANEIKVLSRIQVLTGSLEIAKHFPTLLSFASIEPQDARWVSLSPIYGFSLHKLRRVVQPFITPSSGERNLRSAVQSPQVLTLHIAKQLLCAVKWLHQEGVTHGDIFDDNVMLDISEFRQHDAHRGVWTWRLPTVVLIDFVAASLTPSEIGKMNDRAFLFELLSGLFSLVSLDDNSFLSEAEVLWWDELRQCLAASSIRSRNRAVPSFEVFRKRFGKEIEWRVEGITEAERISVGLLIENVMMREARFPSEEEIEQRLRKWRSGDNQDRE